jgi:hypothetical protein
MNLEKRRFKDAVWVPALSVFCIGAYALIVGLLVFTPIFKTGAEKWGVIGVGMLLVVGVPAVAALLERNLNE